jgi:uncharacterized protein DUF3883
LRRLRDYKDIVLGYDSSNDAYVGLDARRLEHGGERHNASSSIERTVLDEISKKRIVIRPHETQLLGLEYQAIFTPERIAEYLFNVDSIHGGFYLGDGLFSMCSELSNDVTKTLKVSSPRVFGDVLVVQKSSILRHKRIAKAGLVEAYENRNWRALADISPEELEVIRRKCCEVGDHGESFVFKHEKERLRKLGKLSLASKIEWVSRRAIGKGYDILSYEEDGTPRYIEVKASTGRGRTFLMSDNEWQFARRAKRAYFIYRVINVDAAPELYRIVQDPCVAENDRLLERTAAGWRIELK